MTIDAMFLARLFEVVWINLLLSGDNAVVIALACHHLPPRQRRWGVILGVAPAVLILIGSAVIITHLMELPYLRLVGGALLLWIAIGLLKEEEEEQTRLRQSTSLWAAIRIIVVADVVMSLDNVLAIAAVAKGSIALLAIGLAVSVPLVIFGSTILVHLMDRFPMIAVAGAVLIGYVAGDVATDDPAIAPWLSEPAQIAISILCAAAVVPAARLIVRSKRSA